MISTFFLDRIISSFETGFLKIMTNASLFIMRAYGDVWYVLLYIPGMPTKISKLLFSWKDSWAGRMITQPKTKV